jgi:hypothetical protein
MGVQVAFCYGHGNIGRRSSTGASGQKRKGKPWVWASGCQLGWAIFHKSRMWAILGLAVGVAFRNTRVRETSGKTVGFGPLAPHGDAGDLGKAVGLGPPFAIWVCGQPLGTQWVGSAFHIPRVWIASERKIRWTGKLVGYGRPFTSLGAGSLGPVLGTGHFPTLDVPPGYPKEKQRGGGRLLQPRWGR